MKKSLLSIIAAFAVMLGNAQMPDNSICPDFTGTDLNGVEWNLYDILDEGIPVIIEVSAAWCAPCWTYHSSHALKNFYNQYGPEGTVGYEAMVLFIEGESQNTTAQLYGPAGGSGALLTRGDWVTGTPFPIIDDASIANTLEIGFFPTIYLVCPDRVITEIGQVTTAEAYAAVSNASCSVTTLEVDPRLLIVSGRDANCSSPTAGVNVLFQNRGTEVLTEATITITGGLTPVVHQWTGSLGTYEGTTLNINGIETNGVTNVNVAVTSTDENPQNSVAQATVNSVMKESTTHIRVVFTNDPWPAENSWKIRNSSGAVVASSPTNFPSTANAATTTAYNYWVPSVGCYSFEFEDDYGDGMNGAAYGGWNGNINVYSVDNNGNQIETLYSYNGTYALSSEEIAFNVNSVVSTDDIDSVALTALNVYPNPTNGILNLNYSLTQKSEVLVDVINSVGVRVLSKRIGNQSQGTYNTPIDMSALAAGIYMVNLNVEGVISTARVIVK